MITFDEWGVSGHANHVATFRGVQLALGTLARRNIFLLGLKLHTTPFVRKFLGVSDVPLSVLTSEYAVVNFNLIRVLRGMAAHKSQNVWYRILFVLFSRYTYVNTFVKIN